MVTVMNNALTQRQILPQMGERRYRRIQIWSIVGGIFSIVCFLVGSSIIWYSLMIGVIHLDVDSLLPLGIFAFAYTVGLIDVGVWLLFLPISNGPTSYVVSPPAGNVPSAGQGDVHAGSNSSSAVPQQPTIAEEEIGSATNYVGAALVNGIPLQEDTPKTVTDEITKTISKPLIKPPYSPYPDDPPVVQDVLAFQWFIQPREGDKLERSQDKKEYDHKKGRYVVADGVSRSFLPAPWAKIVAKQFIEHDGFFEGQEEKTKWLRMCSQLWHKWVKEEWLPEAQHNSGQVDWDHEIARGAATTFAGCMFSRNDLRENHVTQIRVVVAGDAEFFLLSLTDKGKWESKHFELDLNEFGVETRAIATPEERVERDYKWIHCTDFTGSAGECIVLTTDALAKWILSRERLRLEEDPWKKLLSISRQDEFKSFVLEHRSIGDLEVDDTTMMVIPLGVDAMRDGDGQF